MNARTLFRRAAAYWGSRYTRLAPFVNSARVDKGDQMLLAMRYRERARDGAPAFDFADVGFRAYSQADEDGILLYLFSTIGMTNRIAVEMSVEDGIECNAANLIINHGWDGLLFDGSVANINRGVAFYRRHPDTWLRPPKLVKAWIDAECVNSIIGDHGVSGDIDLFSLDIDGVDYWVLKALAVIRPRVIVVEYRESWGGEARKTVPYRPDFNRYDHHPEYFGASLAAFVAVAREKGYRLVGCERHRINAFFLRNDVGTLQFPEVPASRCTERAALACDADSRLPLGSRFPWQDV